jgi:hypothetical protein
MARGEFLQQFFTERDGALNDANAAKEISVLCPFAHDTGFERNASAHINTEKGVFHCKTCEAEMRFDHGGLSEANFIAKYYGMSYIKAIALMNELSPGEDPDDEDESWSRAVTHLLESPDEMAILAARGITPEAVTEYGLAYNGDGIAYPVRINGVMMDIRTYNPHPTPDDPAKMKSKKGVRNTYLFPFDHWKTDPRPTVVCAGENDTLLARVMGFNAVTGTGGEGRFPELFASFFKDKDVFVCYDGDSAGQKGGANAAYIIKQAGAKSVKMVSLGLTGEKDDKDVTDFFIKHGYTAADFQARLDMATDFTKEEETAVKNVRYPLVDLWRVIEGTYSGKRISSRVTLSGIYDQGMNVPVGAEWVCNGPNLDSEKSPCWGCQKSRQEGIWTMEEGLRDVLKMVEVPDKDQMRELKDIIGIPQKCPNSTIKVMAREPVFKVILTPDVDSTNEGTGTKLVEMYGYTVGLNTELEDGHKYRAFFRTYAHPKDQRTFMVIDKVEDSDNSVNAFKMTDEIDARLQVFKGDPTVMMEDRRKRMHSLTVYFKPKRLIADAYNISFHSILDFNFDGRVIKGYPEIIMVGESRIGKTETGKTFQNYIRMGNTTAIKNATTAGLLGGAESLPRGGWKINWGAIPRNHRGMLILDEMSHLPQHVMGSLTDMRSEGVATIEKIAKGRAPAKTRMVWTSNPKHHEGMSREIHDYPNGVKLLVDLVGADEDIARFDVAMIVVKDDGDLSKPSDKAELPMLDAQLYRDLICWCWSRKSDQVVFDDKVTDYIYFQAEQLNAIFDCHIKLFGVEAFKKLARISVACAASCYSCTDDHESVLVKQEHVDWAVDFLIRCYDNPIFKLKEYATRKKALNETNEVINKFVASILRQHNGFIKQLLELSSHISLTNLRMLSGITDNGRFSELINKMMGASLISNDASRGILPTQRLRKAVNAVRKDETEMELTPLTEKEGFM